MLIWNLYGGFALWFLAAHLCVFASFWLVYMFARLSGWQPIITVCCRRHANANLSQFPFATCGHKPLSFSSYCLFSLPPSPTPTPFYYSINREQSIFHLRVGMRKRACQIRHRGAVSYPHSMLMDFYLCVRAQTHFSSVMEPSQWF